MNNLRFLADVHISPLTVAALKLQGYEILRSTDLLPANAADVDRYFGNCKMQDMNLI
ncbi:MAG: hypothetical protein HEQ12_12845 [Aphanizomenon flos-aquae DEX188]|jgi:hypothetical protein|nr:MAG: hypothetical protein HEQ12_12845 [Aphanizomenon flos-aquae DEX188]